MTRDDTARMSQDVKSAATNAMGEYPQRVEQAWENASDRIWTLKESIERYIQENPTKAVLSALGTGFVIGLMVHRR